jgi:hypothetical protein
LHIKPSSSSSDLSTFIVIRSKPHCKRVRHRSHPRSP